MKLKELVNTCKDKSDLMVDVLSDYLHNILDEDEYCDMCKKVYSEVAGGHYNREFAEKQIAKMYYTEQGEKIFGPFYTESEVYKICEKVQSQIPSGYNFYDFEVALNMIVSDNHNLIEDWFEEEDSQERYVEMTVNWLNDEDNPFGSEKVWGYFNSKI